MDTSTNISLTLDPSASDSSTSSEDVLLRPPEVPVGVASNDETVAQEDNDKDQAVAGKDKEVEVIVRTSKEGVADDKEEGVADDKTVKLIQPFIDLDYTEEPSSNKDSHDYEISLLAPEDFDRVRECTIPSPLTHTDEQFIKRPLSVASPKPCASASESESDVSHFPDKLSPVEDSPTSHLSSTVLLDHCESHISEANKNSQDGSITLTVVSEKDIESTNTEASAAQSVTVEQMETPATSDQVLVATSQGLVNIFSRDAIENCYGVIMPRIETDPASANTIEVS